MHVYTHKGRKQTANVKYSHKYTHNIIYLCIRDQRGKTCNIKLLLNLENKCVSHIFVMNEFMCIIMNAQLQSTCTYAHTFYIFKYLINIQRNTCIHMQSGLMQLNLFGTGSFTYSIGNISLTNCSFGKNSLTNMT